MHAQTSVQFEHIANNRRGVFLHRLYMLYEIMLRKGKETIAFDFFSVQQNLYYFLIQKIDLFQK